MLSMFAATTVLFTGMVAQNPLPQPANPSLSVTGTSEIRVAPDQATVSIGVIAQAKTAQDAQNQANERAQSFIDKAKSVVGRNGTIETGRINLYPVFTENAPRPNEPVTPEIAGYRAENTLVVRLTDFAAIGPVIDTAVASGLNNAQGVTFELKNDTDARMQALAEAVKQARRKAEVMARAGGVDLQGVWEISENGAQVVPFEARTMMAAGKASTPVIPGMVTISADVTVRYFVSRG